MTTTYSVSRDTIITTALRKLQVIELGVTPDTDTLTNAAQSLNIMIKAWQSQGIKLWTIDEYVLPLVANQTAYIISPTGPDLVGNKPLKVIQAWIRNTQVTPNIDTPLQILSKQEYNILGSKQSTGTTNSIFYDPRVTTGILYVYLTPDANTAINYQLHFVAQRPMTDINTGTDVPDFPTEWQQALIWGLADELAIEYGCHINQRQEIAVKADKYRRELEDWDVEYVSTMFTPDQRSNHL
jgi:hypothetical protein